MILACHQPWHIALDILYTELLGSGVGGMGKNHSTYVRWVGAVAKDGNKLGIDLIGS